MADLESLFSEAQTAKKEAESVEERGHAAAYKALEKTYAVGIEFKKLDTAKQSAWLQKHGGYTISKQSEDKPYLHVCKAVFGYSDQNKSLIGKYGKVLQELDSRETAPDKVASTLNGYKYDSAEKKKTIGGYLGMLEEMLDRERESKGPQEIKWEEGLNNLLKNPKMKDIERTPGAPIALLGTFDEDGNFVALANTGITGEQLQKMFAKYRTKTTSRWENPAEALLAVMSNAGILKYTASKPTALYIVAGEDGTLSAQVQYYAQSIEPIANITVGGNNERILPPGVYVASCMETSDWAKWLKAKNTETTAKKVKGSWEITVKDKGTIEVDMWGETDESRVVVKRQAIGGDGANWSASASLDEKKAGQVVDWIASLKEANKKKNAEGRAKDSVEVMISGGGMSLALPGEEKNKVVDAKSIGTTGSDAASVTVRYSELEHVFKQFAKGKFEGLALKTTGSALSITGVQEGVEVEALLSGVTYPTLARVPAFELVE